jgi:hypothetical protein
MVKFAAPDSPLKSPIEERISNAETMMRRTWNVLAPGEALDFFEIDTGAREVVLRLDDLASVAAEALAYCEACGAADLAARLRISLDQAKRNTLIRTGSTSSCTGSVAGPKV